MDFIPKKELSGYRGYSKKFLIKIVSVSVLSISALFLVVGFYTYQEHQFDIEVLKQDLALATLPQTATASEAPKFGVWPALSDPDFFQSVKNSYIDSGTSFIEANLSEMRLRVHSGGEIQLDVPIKTKGREGSWWETPSGLYEVKLKEKNHLSSLGGVYMPWSIQFQGNFFIHGWPYYPDKTPVSSSYSGGCVRLADEDASEVYKLAKNNMPILVYENDFIPDDFAYQITAPHVTAESYLAIDLHNNFVMLSDNDEERLPSYTLPKLITGLVASEHINIENNVLIQKKNLVPTNIPRLLAGERYSIYDLLHPLVIEGSSEAAEAIVNSLGEVRFHKLAKEKLSSIGIENSVVTTASGWDGKSETTTQDMFKLLKYIYNNRPFLLSLSGKQKSAYAPSKINTEKEYAFSTSGLIGGMIAGESKSEVAYTENSQAGAALLFAPSSGQSSKTKGVLRSDAAIVYEIPFKDSVRPIAFILLSSEDPISDIENMRNYVLERYQ